MKGMPPTGMKIAQYVNKCITDLTVNTLIVCTIHRCMERYHVLEEGGRGRGGIWTCMHVQMEMVTTWHLCKSYKNGTDGI